jgi:poly-gamma-glutamate capsule biosynthesis protein CapA/YwtB (metallophosphatase superfamily)
MTEEFTVAIVGDTLINRRISVVTDERFLSLINIIRNADVGYAQMETLIHDYEGPDLYPAAESGFTWVRSPRFVVDELKWAGFDIVSLASNHSLDYSYGGLFSTLDALDKAGIHHAGTGRNLGEAREPAYMETPKGRVALVSMCSSFARWGRAGDTRRDMKGRPGVNPLRFYYKVDGDTLGMIVQLASKLGWWVRKIDKTLLINPPGQHWALYKFVESDQPGIITVPDEDDVDGNLRSIREARRQADWVLVHLHNHEWEPNAGLSAPPTFATTFARACIDTGADVFIGQGSHTLFRGIEMYKEKPIFYDPGDFILMTNTITRLPADSYFRKGYSEEVQNWKATTSDCVDARIALPTPMSPAGGYPHYGTGILGHVVAVCSFKQKAVTNIELYPFTLVREPRSQHGLPMLCDTETARSLIQELATLSRPFGTQIDFKDGRGMVKM